MRNRILSLTRSTIPYIKELQPITGGVAGCILMQQLDFWFERYPQGFWKFLKSCPGHDKYKEGDSWTEELGMSVDEFRTAFDKIGNRHKSKAAYDSELDQFKGKYYCSYIDRRQNLTFYFRNHDLLDAQLDSLVFKSPATPRTQSVAGVQVSGNKGIEVTVNGDSQFTGSGHLQSPHVGNPHSQETENTYLLNTEITVSETKQIPLLLPTDPAQPADTVARSGASDLIHPRGLSPTEQEIIEELILDSAIPSELKQKLLDELAGAIQTKVIKRGAVPFFNGLIAAVSAGRFTPSLGISVLSSRRNEQNRTAREAQEKISFALNPEVMKKGQEKLDSIRKRFSTCSSKV